MKISRRGTLRTAMTGIAFAATTAVGQEGRPPEAAASTVSGESSSLGLGAVEAVAAMRRGELKAEAHAGALVAQAQRLAPLNAFRKLDVQAVLEAARAADKAYARGQASGQLHGLPIPIKDSINTRSLPTSNGTQALAEFRPARDAGVLSRLLHEGAIVMGKTNLHEVSLGWTSNNEIFGPVRNPYDRTRSPGGSSGGSAVAVAARMAPVAIAEDTWGSIRIPSGFCGIAGFRPSRGRYPDDGIMPLTQVFDQVGLMARFMEDLIMIDRVAARDPWTVKPVQASNVRIALCAPLWDGVDSEIERVAQDAMARLREAGLTVIDAPAPFARNAAKIVGAIAPYELQESIATFLRQQDTGVSFADLHAKLSPRVKGVMDAIISSANKSGRQAYEVALAHREALQSELATYVRDHRIQALVFPSAMVQPPKIGEEAEVTINIDNKISSIDAFGRNAGLATCAGMTSLVLPAGLTTGGLPVGLEFASLHGQDRQLLSLGLLLERSLGRIEAPVDL